MKLSNKVVHTKFVLSREIKIIDYNYTNTSLTHIISEGTIRHIIHFNAI